jgi:uncharacterized protein (TIGR02466 family)
MPVDHWFPTSIYWNDLDLDRDRLRATIDTLPTARPEPWLHKCDTSYFVDRMLHHRPEMDAFCRAVTVEMQAYSRELGADLDTHVILIKDMWFNRYHRGDAQEFHIHAGSHLSGVYYLEADEGAAVTAFENPLTDREMLPMPVAGEFTIVRYEPVAGRVLLFRSWLRHMVGTQTTDAARTTISWNAVLWPRDSLPRAG